MLEVIKAEKGISSSCESRNKFRIDRSKFKASIGLKLSIKIW